MEVMLLKEEMPGGEFIVGNSAPLTSLGQETLGRSFLLWFDVFPSFLHQLQSMAGGGGVGWGVPVLFHIGLKGHPAEKLCFPSEHSFSGRCLFF